VVGDRSQERCIVMNSNSWVSCGISLCDLQGFIRAAIVNNRVVPVLVCLRQNAFDAFSEIPCTVVNGRDDAHTGLGLSVHSGWVAYSAGSTRLW